MTPPASPFHWHDRDTAARDMLAIVHHAPLYLSRLASRLLRAFRSPAILPDLHAIIFSDAWDNWVRINALRAVTAVRGPLFVPEFAPLAIGAVARLEQALAQQDHPQKARSFSGLAPDLLDELALLVDAHPENQGWYFSAIDAARPLVQKHILGGRLASARSDDFRTAIVRRLTTLVDAQPDLLDLGIIDELLHADAEADHWLEGEFDRVLALALAEPNSNKLRFIARDWERLNAALRDHIPGWDIYRGVQRRVKEPPTYPDSRAFRLLRIIFEEARGGNDGAFYTLGHIAHKRGGNVAMRAVATHYIGQLYEQFDVFLTLAALMRSPDATKYDDKHYWSIHYEAGVGLLNIPTPATWETLVDTFFVKPNDDLIDFQLDWIEYVTDRLSGIATPYDGLHLGNVSDRTWFRQLASVTYSEMFNSIKPNDHAAGNPVYAFLDKLRQQEADDSPE